MTDAECDALIGSIVQEHKPVETAPRMFCCEGRQDDGRMEGRDMTEKAKRQKLPKARTITLPDQDYQPPKAELEKAYDMPGASLQTVRSAFFRPINVKRRSR